jgi:hypothetical protein
MKLSCVRKGIMHIKLFSKCQPQKLKLIHLFDPENGLDYVPKYEQILKLTFFDTFKGENIL